MSEFIPGQTVWLKDRKGAILAGKVRAVEGDDVWVGCKDGFSATIPACRLTAIDPNQPEPQKCPFCGSEPHCHDYVDGDWQARCDQNTTGCGCKGPYRPTRQEAIAAWNSIRIGNDIDDAIADVLAKPKDSDLPLTEEWLRKVGLYDGEFHFTWRGPEEQRLAFIVKGYRSDCEWAFCPAYCKTIADARTLCRLLGVPLKEDA